MSDEDYLYTLESEGMIYRGYNWIKITCTVKVDRETEKAVHGRVTVIEDDSEEYVYTPEIHWIPKSQAEKPWFICTQIFDEENKVSNRRWA